MLESLLGIYYSNKYNIKPDIICFHETVPANTIPTVILTNALNGSSLKSDLSTYDYFIIKANTWTTNGFIHITILPDSSQDQKTQLVSLPQKNEVFINPPINIRSELSVTLENTLSTDTDIYLHFDIIKIKQDTTPIIIDEIGAIIRAITNTDLQTLSIQNNVSYMSSILTSIAVKDNIVLPENIPVSVPQNITQSTSSCRRRL